MIHNLHRLWSQVELLKTLVHQPASVSWARQSIKDATHEIERVAADDAAADYAVAIRLELAQISPERGHVRLADTAVGDALDTLVRYVDVIGTSKEHFEKPLRGL